MAKDILLNKDGDLAIVNGDFAFGENQMQRVAIILQLKQGDLKSDPLLGANLVSLMRSVQGKAKAIVKATLHLKRDGIDYNSVKAQIEIDAKEN